MEAGHGGSRETERSEPGVAYGQSPCQLPTRPSSAAESLEIGGRPLSERCELTVWVANQVEASVTTASALCARPNSPYREVVDLEFDRSLATPTGRPPFRGPMIDEPSDRRLQPHWSRSEDVRWLESWGATMALKPAALRR
jgi:hypothetical protein